MDRAALEIAAPLLQPMRMVAYVYGHIDGSVDQLSLNDKTRRAIEDAGFQPFLDQLVAALRHLWSLGPDWDDPAQFDVIADVARDVLWCGGLLIAPAEGEAATIDVWDPELIDPQDLELERYWKCSSC